MPHHRQRRLRQDERGDVPLHPGADFKGLQVHRTRGACRRLRSPGCCRSMAWFAAHRVQAAAVPDAPIDTEYQQRDRIVASTKAGSRRSRRPDYGADVGRSVLATLSRTGRRGRRGPRPNQAERSLRLQPQGNVQASAGAGLVRSVVTSLRRRARRRRRAIDAEPFDENAWAQKASLLMELGRYRDAGASLRARIARQSDVAFDPRTLRRAHGTSRTRTFVMLEATRTVDEGIRSPAYTRSWFHVRDGQLAFEAGDPRRQPAGIRRSAAHLSRQRDGADVQANSTAPAAIGNAPWLPQRQRATLSLPQALGYEVDAQRALGDVSGARRTDALIPRRQRAL